MLLHLLLDSVCMRYKKIWYGQVVLILPLIFLLLLRFDVRNRFCFLSYWILICCVLCCCSVLIQCRWFSSLQYLHLYFDKPYSFCRNIWEGISESSKIYPRMHDIKCLINHEGMRVFSLFFVNQRRQRAKDILSPTCETWSKVMYHIVIMCRYCRLIHSCVRQ